MSACQGSVIISVKIIGTTKCNDEAKVRLSTIIFCVCVQAKDNWFNSSKAMQIDF